MDNVEVSLEDKSGFVSSILGRLAFLFLASVVVESVRAQRSQVQPSSVDEVKERLNRLARKTDRREPGRYGKILLNSDHMH